jgi:hypothetical protein
MVKHKSEQLLPIVPHSPGFLLIIVRPPYPAVGCISFLDWKHPQHLTHQVSGQARCAKTFVVFVTFYKAGQAIINQQIAD